MSREEFHFDYFCQHKVTGRLKVTVQEHLTDSTCRIKNIVIPLMCEINCKLRAILKNTDPCPHPESHSLNVWEEEKLHVSFHKWKISSEQSGCQLFAVFLFFLYNTPFFSFPGGKWGKSTGFKAFMAVLALMQDLLLRLQRHRAVERREKREGENTYLFALAADLHDDDDYRILWEANSRKKKNHKMGLLFPTISQNICRPCTFIPPTWCS